MNINQVDSVSQITYILFHLLLQLFVDKAVKISSYSHAPVVLPIIVATQEAEIRKMKVRS
jgi:hypothetical protein